MNIQPSLFDDFEIDNNGEEQVEQPKQLTGEEARIVELRETLNRHNHSYYVLNQPTISDQEFDHLMRELQDLEAKHPEMADPLSPTQRVGSDLSQGFKQVQHERPMMSLGNSYSIEEVQDFLRRAKEGLGGEPVEILSVCVAMM